MSDAVLGGLIGSTLTVLIARIFSLIQKRIEYKNSLRKHFLEKKLSAAEAAISQGHSVTSCLRSMLLVFELRSEHPELVIMSSPEFLNAISDFFNRQVNILSSSAISSGYLAKLYFDIFDYQDQPSEKEILRLIFSISALNNFMLEVAGRHAAEQNTADKESLFNLWKNMFEEMGKELKSLSELMKEVAKQIDGSFISIRLELKNDFF